MINYNYDLKEQIESEYTELDKCKNSYIKKISLYNTYIDNIKKFENIEIEKNNLDIRELENKIENFQIQINKIDINMNLLNNFKDNIYSLEPNQVDKYNQNDKEIKSNYINNSISEEDITAKYINVLASDISNTIKSNKDYYENNTQSTNNFVDTNCIEETCNYNGMLKNNDTLLISEKTGKVILPYRIEEIIEIFNDENDKYESYEDVIEDRFTRKFSDYKIQFSSRYTETMKLAREKENYNLVDSIALSFEMMRNKYLHPAIISACKNLNELDVYLDCLDKNELEDFKIFKIKYELYPMIVKKEKIKRNSNKTILHSF